jgi:membrane-bound lytic murein transglycosylase D
MGIRLAGTKAIHALLAIVVALAGCAASPDQPLESAPPTSAAPPAPVSTLEPTTSAATSDTPDSAAAPTDPNADADEPTPPVAADNAPDADTGNVALNISGTPEPVDVSAQDGAEPVINESAAGTAVPDDLWARIRRGFKLNHDHKRVKGELAWYQRNQEYLNRVVDRAEPFLFLIVEEVEKRGMPMEIALLPVIESAFQPFAYSHGRASGIWQFIPGTGRLYGLKQNWWYDGRRDVIEATRAALDYFQALATKFNGDWELALASYNTGEGNVERAVVRNKKRKRPADFWNLKLPAETRGYVPRLHAVAAIVDDPARFGITLRSLANQPVLANVGTGGQIDMAFAANLADMSLEELYRLNPAFNRWATDPDGPHRLLVPLDKAEVFEQRLAQFPIDQRTRWVERPVGEGETLSAIAKAYGTTADVLERINKLKSKKVRPGRELIIPVSMHSLDDDVLIDALDSMPEPAAPLVPDSNEPDGERIEVVIKRGDTLYGLARKHRVNAKDIANWNRMKIGDPLVLGRTLVIWSQDPDELDTVVIASAVSAPLAAPPREEVMRQINYVVRRGDTLARIAERFKVTIGQIQQWNRLSRDRRLRPGQRITLHVDVTRQ